MKIIDYINIKDYSDKGTHKKNSVVLEQNYILYIYKKKKLQFFFILIIIITNLCTSIATIKKNYIKVTSLFLSLINVRPLKSSQVLEVYKEPQLLRLVRNRTLPRPS